MMTPDEPEECLIQIRDYESDPWRWVTVGRCPWESADIIREVNRLRAAGETRDLWVQDPTTGLHDCI
jgi:hypothetical protein